MTRALDPKGAGVMTKYAVGAAAVVLAAGLLWGLRSLILPASVGGLLAYICRPFAARLERYGMPRGLAVGLMLLIFGAATLVGLSSIRAATPSEAAILELRVRVLYALNERYQSLMGLDPYRSRGNGLYRLTHRDVDPLMHRLSAVLALSPEEREVLGASQQRGTDAGSDRSGLLLAKERVNAETLELRARRAMPAEPAPKLDDSASSPAPLTAEKGGLVDLGTVLSTWAVAPLIFLFLLWDTGSIKRALLKAIPNRFFEPALAVLDDVDRAIGSYVRGIFLECCALGLTVTVFITIVGVSFRWAIAIGIFTGLSNVIPYMGFFASLLCVLLYSLLVENVHPVLPLVTSDTFVIWALASVALAELLKNFVYEPMILGGSVKLHPLVVVIGVVGGGIMFGPAGTFLALPTITIVRVLIASSTGHLKAYGLV